MKKALSLVLLSTLLTNCTREDILVNSIKNHMQSNANLVKSSSAKNALRTNPNFQLLCQAANEGAL